MSRPTICAPHDLIASALSLESRKTAMERSCAAAPCAAAPIAQPFPCPLFVLCGPQTQADVLGARVVRPAVVETTALGAAYAAGKSPSSCNRAPPMVCVCLGGRASDSDSARSRRRGRPESTVHGANVRRRRPSGGLLAVAGPDTRAVRQCSIRPSPADLHCPVLSLRCFCEHTRVKRRTRGATVPMASLSSLQVGTGPRVRARARRL